jgi:hypothetical protein
MRALRNYHLGPLIIFIVLFLAILLALPSAPSQAQVEVLETLWMSDGDRTTKGKHLGDQV